MSVSIGTRTQVPDNRAYARGAPFYMGFRSRSQVAPDEEEGKPVLSMAEKKAAASKKLTAIQRQRRRSWRLICFVLFAGFLTLVWLAAVSPFMRLEDTKTFPNTGSLSIELDGCDLDFVLGTEHKVTYSAALAAFQMEWTNSDVDADEPTSAVFGNNIGCEDQPLSSCRYVCLVTVTVPSDSVVEFEVSPGPTSTRRLQPHAAEAATPQHAQRAASCAQPAALRVQVKQSDLDAGGVTNWPLVTVKPGAKLASLQVGEWFGYQQTLAVTVDNATVGNLGTYLVRGDVRARTRHGMHSASRPNPAVHLQPACRPSAAHPAV